MAYRTDDTDHLGNAVLDSFVSAGTSAALDGLVRSITIETSLTPPMVLDRPFEPGPPNAMLQYLRPRITLTPTVGTPIILAPYGAPAAKPEYLLILAVAAALGGLATAGAFYTLGRRGCRC